VEIAWRAPGQAILRPMRFRFGPFELDVAQAELRADGVVRPLEPQVFSLLVLLVANRERLVSRDEIIEKVWDGRIVSDSAISSRIKAARRALDDDGRDQRYIRTLHRQGFRFVADVQAVTDSPAEVREPGATAARSPAPELTASRPSIAVLPFHQVGDPGSYAAVAEALPHELIAELSRLRWLFVTARESSFRLRTSDASLREIGRLLGVTYCLTGTVELVRRRLFVTVELTDTRNDGVVWANRFEGSIDDVHAIRTEIRVRVVSALELEIPLREAAIARLSSSENLDAWSAYHLGLQHMFRFNRHDNVAAAALFTQAVTRDPGFARAHAGLSFVHFQTAFLRHTEDLPAAIALARAHAERGLELDPIDPFVNFTMGRTYWLQGDLDASLPWLDRAVAVNPNYAQGVYARAWTESLTGRGQESRGHADLAMRLSPLDPMHYAMLGTRALGHIDLGEDLEAAGWAERAARAPGAHVMIAMIAASAHGLAGDAARAAYWAANVRSRNPALTRDDFFRAFPMKPALVRARVSASLQALGF
jgi:TolB-like protein